MLPKRNSIRNHGAESALVMRRTIVTFIVILFAIGILITNLYYLQISSFNSYKTRSNDNRISVQTIPPNRGLIYDRNGVILAENRSVYSLQVIVRNTLHLKDDIKHLTKLLSLNPVDKVKGIIEVGKKTKDLLGKTIFADDDDIYVDSDEEEDEEDEY